MRGWPEDHIAALRKLEGQTATEMAKAMQAIRPGVTRLACVGQCKRRNIRMSKSSQSETAARTRINAGAAALRAATYGGRPPRGPSPVPASPPLDGSAPVTLVERGAHQCAWPVGEPARPADQLFCAAPCTHPGAVYCAAHAKMAGARYVPSFLAKALDGVAA